MFRAETIILINYRYRTCDIKYYSLSRVSNFMKQLPGPSKIPYFRLWKVYVSLASMTYGSALGWPSPVLVQISQTGLPFTLDASQISWMVSLVYVTNLLSPLPAGALMDALGRKKALILLTLPALISWPIALLATDVRWLYLARLLVGIQGGASTTIAPTYISETACAKHRGAMNTMGMFFCFVGIFYSYIIGHLVSYASLCLLNGLIPLTFILLFSLLLPDTPYWYLMKNNPQLAAESLAWLNSTTTPHIQNELNLIQNGVQQQISNKNSFEELLRSATNRRALIIVLALTFTQRMSGFGSLLAFGSTALPDLSFMTAEQCNIIVGATWMLSIPISGYLIDIFGRKPLTLISSSGTFLSMTIIGTYFYLSPFLPLPNTHNFIPFLFTLIFSVLFSIGLGPIALLLPSELFPANVKAKASAVASICQAAAAFLSNIIWLDVVESVGLYMNFFIFAAVSLAFYVFSIFFFIETKGKTLEEIQDELNSEQRSKSVI